MMRRTVRTVIGYAGSGGLALALLASCSLGLDESLIGQTDAGDLDTGPPADAGADTRDAALPPGNPEGGACTTDSDCKAPSNACLKAHCDLPRKACVFDVCKPQACSSSACDLAAQTCAPPKSHPYKAAQFPVGAGIGCGGVLGRCFAVVYPYVFVGTPNGVLAFSASDPASATPTPVSVAGQLGFVPAQIIASGSRVFFLGNVAYTGPTTSRVSLGWIDVPADPFVKGLVANVVVAAYNRSAGEPLTLAPRANDTALLIDGASSVSYPLAALEPANLVDPVSLTATPIPFTAGTSPVAASGTRLVMQQISATGSPTFGFINGAGTTSPTNAGDVGLVAAAPVSGPQGFVTGADGAVFWTVESLTGPTGGPPPAVRAVKGYFLVADGNAGTFDTSAGVDIESTYGGPVAGSLLVGPAAMLDANTVLVTAANPANTAQTSVQFVTKQPLGLVKNADNTTPRKAIIPAPVYSLAAAGSNGIGYVLAQESVTAMSVYVFDPACAP